MSQPLQLDHLVYAVPDLAEAIEDLERRLGARAALGGRHEGVGTHNAILPLQDATYLELIALDPERGQPPLPPPFGLADLHEPRLVTWAVRSFEIEADVARAREAGYDPGLLVPASRNAPDGRLLEWKLTIRPDGMGGGTIPFLIDWEATPHPTATHDRDGALLRLCSLHATHPAPAEIRAALSLLGTELDVRGGAGPGLRAEIEGPGGAAILA